MGIAQDRWHKANKDKNREYRRERDKSDKAKAYRNAYMKQKRDEGKYKYSYDENAEYQKQYKQQYRKDNPHLHRWREIFNRTLNTLKQDKDTTTETLMGYSANELNEYLMSLDKNWIEQQVDHMIPITWFKPNTPIHIINDFRNLQVLSIDENKVKGNRYAHKVDDEYLQVVMEWIKDRYRSSLK